MDIVQELILAALKKELEKQNSEEAYSQWILAVAVIPFEPTERTAYLEENKPTHTARVILKTSDSPYVDGTDIYFTVELEKQLADCERWEYIWVEYEPIFHGGIVEDSLKWLNEIGEPFYIQLTNPFK